jgi:cupin superfamily acireductone dioxygenase involved in methionine salvage
MKLLLTVLIFAGLSAFVSAENNRTEMAELLKERKALFDEYSASLTKKSGFFGNKTKNDLRESQAQLKKIVATDNKIIGVLNRTVDYKNFEKLSMTYDVSSYANRIENLTSLNESLMKQNTNYANEINSNKSVLKRYMFYNAMLIAVLLAIIAFWGFRKFIRS